jgi:PAS domain S-box-containing protein
MTETLLTEQALEGKVAHDLIMTAMDDFSDGFLVFDEELSFRYVNAAAERTLGLDRREILGKPFLRAFPSARGSVFEDAFRRCLGGSDRLDFQTFFGVDGEAGWYDVRVSPADSGVSVRLRRLDPLGGGAAKDWAATELSHRIKNSLSMIASLASLETSSVGDGAAREGLDRL